MTSPLADETFVLKSHVETKTGRLVLIDIRYAKKDEIEERRGRHHIQEGDYALFDDILSDTTGILKRLRFQNRMLAQHPWL
jgi:hypothetical protein